ncbi:universal stress protein [Tenacibaculum jejuense]|uniref:UspA n=1 Tax=Tenacibaculum jejuense TaxID=584609 RepID=A0A238U8X1_9FLAO|nr:universal stress protein [Tenacibaculum jejuense]SNR14934.1 UspA [Tenacibaculum jejuense]
MKRILVPVDFSIQSENALKTAAYYGRTFDYEIVAVHMLELSTAMMNNSNTTKETVLYLKLAENKFNEFLDKDYLKDVKVTPILKHYKVFTELNTLYNEEKIDLVMMGSKGATGFKEFLIGSNAQKVIRHSNVPVLVIKDEPLDHGFKKAIFACDFTDDSIGPYKRIKEFCDFIGLQTKMIYVNTPGKSFLSSAEMRNTVKNFFDKANNNSDHLEDVSYISDYTIEAGITNYAKSYDADIIIMTTHGRSSFSQIFDHSITEDVVNHVNIPVISFKILPKSERK